MSAAPPDIFISYAREDLEWVRPLAAELEACGWRVFWDRRIPAGKDWRSHIGAALEAARCVVVVWSEHSIASRFVLEEADEGKARDVLVPILRQRVRIPLGFRYVHAADLAAWRLGQPSAEFETFIADLGEMLASSTDVGPALVALEADVPVVAPPPLPSPPASSPPAAPKNPAGDGSAPEDQGPPAAERQPPAPVQPDSPAAPPEVCTPRAGEPANTPGPPPARKRRTGALILLSIVVMGAVGAGIYVANRPPPESAPHNDVPPILRDDLTPDQWQKVQRWLNTQGFDVGPADGTPGPRTIQAVEAWRSRTGEPAAGSLVAAVLAEATQAVPPPGSTFTDTLKDGSPCPFCPEMVVIGAGSFTMGSPPSETDRHPNEGPQRTVTLARPFAIGRHEVSFAEWDACVTAGGCGGSRPDDAGWGRGTRPVINVSWNDAQAFVSWLSQQTGESYGLPTEAQWEFAARGGTTTPFWTGATISTAQANYDGNYTYGSGVKGTYRAETMAADDPSFPANPFGLFHVNGNVWEWIQDCYVASYAGAPAEGQVAVDRDDCRKRVLRGGSWVGHPGDLRSANRGGSTPGDRDSFTGFRVARMLNF